MKAYLKITAAAAAAMLLLPASAAVSAEGTADTAANKAYETHDTLGGIGSVSKMFVTAAAMQLADQGKIDLDAPVTDYLPELSSDRYSCRTLTSEAPDNVIRMLSGILAKHLDKFNHVIWNRSFKGKFLSGKRMNKFQLDGVKRLSRECIYVTGKFC